MKSIAAGHLTMLRGALLLAAGGFVAGASGASAQGPSTSDPRSSLKPGWQDAGSAAWNMEPVGHHDRPQGFVNRSDVGDFQFWNSDIAFRGNTAFVGSFNGLTIFDISDPTRPQLLSTLVCPGGQGDPSLHGNLLFMSVEETRGRLDCGTQGIQAQVSPERFRGVRIFDVSDPRDPKPVAAVQTCRGSHTHTLVTDPNDRANVYVYVSGTSVARADAELAGCTETANAADPNSSYWSIAVIQVPLDAPQRARIVSEPRVFANLQSGAIAGLWQGGSHGPGTQTTSETDQCHDITVYPEIGLAAGACSGNGILLDIRDPVNPKRIAAVSDPNFAYWHSATFNNDGTKVIFTDEWGGGTAPRCRASDPVTWGANAIYNLVGGKLEFASHYKLPAAQTATENCVAHNGSLVPVPGRDIKVQAWYQGGISVFDFTDAQKPVEIAYFDRGPISSTTLNVGGFWSAYWYNGFIYGSEMARGLDVFRLAPSEHLSRNEIEAAGLVRFQEFNAQNQPRMTWPAAPVVALAYVDQLARSGGIPAEGLSVLRDVLGRFAQASGAQRQALSPQLIAQAEQLEFRAGEAGARDRDRVVALAATLKEMAAAH